jgi:hypothetical protein
MQSAAPLPTGVPEEGVGLLAFFSDLQMLDQKFAGPGAPLREAAAPWLPLTPETRESLWGQLQAGIISNLNPGESQVSLSLNPPELGQIQLTLRLSGQELAVTAVATRPEVAELASQGVQHLLQALAQQGLVLANFQVLLHDQAPAPATPVFAGTKENNEGNSEKKYPSPSRRPSQEVDRFV